MGVFDHGCAPGCFAEASGAGEDPAVANAPAHSSSRENGRETGLFEERKLWWGSRGYLSRLKTSSVVVGSQKSVDPTDG